MSAGADRNEFAVYELLGNERRRIAIECLIDAGRTLTVRELAVEVATRETGETPPPSNKRHSVYTTLTRAHIPKLADHGVVSYDEDAKEVRLEKRVLDRHEVDSSGRGRPWAEYHLVLGIVAMAAIGLAAGDVATFAVVDPLPLAAAFLALFVGSSCYQLWTLSR